MKTIIATLIAAVLAVCATVWPPAATANTTLPTIEPPPAVTAEIAPAEPQEVKLAPYQKQPNPELQTGPNQSTVTEAPEPTPKEVITEKKEITPVAETPEPIVKEAIAPQLPAEEPTIVEPTKTDPEIIIEHAKTGYEKGPSAEPPVVGPEPPAQTADIDTAIAAAEAHAIEVYNVVIDSFLDFTNSAYRFPAVVPLTADQETLNTKAIDIVDYTFQQQIRQHGVSIEKIRESGIRCKIVFPQKKLFGCAHFGQCYIFAQQLRRHSQRLQPSMWAAVCVYFSISPGQSMIPPNSTILV